MKKIFLLMSLLGFISINMKDLLFKNSPFHLLDATFKMSIEKELSENKIYKPKWIYTFRGRWMEL